MLSKTIIRSFSQVEDSTIKFKNFVQYFKTPASLRSWIYRPKNANKLLSLDLKDSETGKPLKPQNPMEIPRATDLNNIIFNLKSKEELEKFFQTWIDITPRKALLWKYFTPTHLQNLLVVSAFRLNCYGFTLNQLYQLHPRFKKAENVKIYNLDEWFNTVVMCQLQRYNAKNIHNPVFAKKKIESLWALTSLKMNENGLTHELIDCLNKQQATDIKLEFDSRPFQFRTISLDMSNGKLAKFVTNNMYIYLQARTALEFGSENLNINKFVTLYQKILEKLGKSDIYDNYMTSLKQFDILPEKEEKSSQNSH